MTTLVKIMKRSSRMKYKAELAKLETSFHKENSRKIYKNFINNVPEKLRTPKTVGLYAIEQHPDGVSLRDFASYFGLYTSDVFYPTIEGERIYFEKEPEILFVPSIVLDYDGNRIGDGKGLYDKYLKEYNGYSVGICYDFQVVGRVGTEDQDQKVNMIITEKRIVQFIEK